MENKSWNNFLDLNYIDTQKKSTKYTYKIAGSPCLECWGSLVGGEVS